MDRSVYLLRQLIKKILTFPISPSAFIFQTSVLRNIGFLRRPDQVSGNEIKRIFISHPYSSIGDMVLLLPLIERIQSEWPAATIDIAVGSSACDLLEGVPDLNRIFVCGSHRSRFGFFGVYWRLMRNLLLYRREIMNYNYDLAIAPRWGSILTSEAVYLAYLTGAPRRIGYSGSVDGGGEAINALLTHSVVGGQHEHETLRNLKILERAGIGHSGSEDDSLVFRPIPSMLNLAKQGSTGPLVKKPFSGISPIPNNYAIVAPGATNPQHIWPAKLLAQVMLELHRTNAVYFFIVGSAADASKCENLARLASHCAISIAGKTSLIELVRLISGAGLFLGMDSGIAHVAGALGVPTIVISPFPSICTEEHPHSPERFRPCGPYVQILQPKYPIPPCHPTCSFSEPHCIQQVAPDEVLKAAIGFIAMGPQKRKFHTDEA
jgi:ADP-heptose:LPS heptosyltransferase